MRYKSTDWSVRIPSDWQYEEGRDCTAFFHPDGSGALQVSDYRKDSPISDDDLYELIDNAVSTRIDFAQATGFRSEYVEDGVFWTKWWLRLNNLLIFATYNCSVKNRGQEDDEVNFILDSLRVETVR